MNKSNSDLLIRDIHLPDSVDWWPIAPGWWLLFFLGLFIVLIAYKKIKKQLNKKNNSTQFNDKTITNAINLLNRINNTSDDKQAIRKISVLLRRTAMSLYGRENIAGLTGTKWLKFLDVAGSTTDFSHGSGQVLIQQPYKKITTYDRNKLVAITEQWLRSQIQAHTDTDTEKEGSGISVSGVTSKDTGLPGV